MANVVIIMSKPNINENDYKIVIRIVNGSVVVVALMDLDGSDGEVI